MSEPYRRLGEGLDPRGAPDSASFPVDPRKVKAWVETLPRANPAATQRQLLEALKSLARTRHDGGQRLACLEAMRPILLEAVDQLEAQMQGITIPLPAPKARAHEQLVEFDLLLALNYRVAVVELCAPSGGVPFLRGGSVALAIERAMLHTSRSFMHAYVLYQPPAAGCWAALHALYQFARAARLDGKQVEDAAAGGQIDARSLYIQALLLAFSNPYRFSQRDQQELWRVAGVLGRQLDVVDEAIGADLIGVPYAGDSGPGYIPLERAQSGEPLLWIDLAGVRKVIDDRVDGGDGGPVRLQFAGGHAIDTTLETLRRIRAGWGRASARRNQRLSAGHVLETVLGLSGLHFHLAGLLDFESFQGRAGHEADDPRGEMRAIWTRGNVDASRVPVARAEVLDQSLGGYHLRWPSDENAKARVGDLLGMCVPASEDERHWLLGVVRWMRFNREGAVEAGVELLSRRARAVALRPLDGNDAGTLQRGIEFEPVRDARPGRVHLAVPAAFDCTRPRVELLRVPLADDLDAPVAMRQPLADCHVGEDAADYRLVDLEAGR